jgi:RNA polymerase sigma-70 factor (ECF subfamily)
VSDSAQPDPADVVAEAEQLSLALLVALERLNPVERAVFLLREPFDLSYREIAEVVGKSEAACRQIEHRARQRLNEEGGPPRPADPEEHGRLLSGFLHAVKDGDLQKMMALLADDAVLISDGGGKARAALLPIYGSDRITRFFNSIVTKFGDAGIEARPAIVNGEPGTLNFLGGQLTNVLSIQIEDGRIRRLFLVANPDKLARLAQVAGGG